MQIEDLLEEFDEICGRAWNLPLSGGKILLDAKKVREILYDIKSALPGELRQAKAIVADRTEIIKDAKNEAQIIVRTSEERAKAIVEQDNLVKQAKSRASDLLTQAEAKAKEVRRATNEYVNAILKRTDEFFTSNLADIRKTRHDLGSSFK
ncbi:MAG: ATPase [Oscillospiraceae bacterium]|jgi:cell division septum initiation protein DivIVA|nr:ATPase [Oscillospiraceae bacterium]